MDYLEDERGRRDVSIGSSGNGLSRSAFKTLLREKTIGAKRQSTTRKHLSRKNSKRVFFLPVMLEIISFYQGSTLNVTVKIPLQRGIANLTGGVFFFFCLSGFDIKQMELSNGAKRKRSVCFMNINGSITQKRIFVKTDTVNYMLNLYLTY